MEAANLSSRSCIGSNTNLQCGCNEWERLTIVSSKRLSGLNRIAVPMDTMSYCSAWSDRRTVSTASCGSTQQVSSRHWHLRSRIAFVGAETVTDPLQGCQRLGLAFTAV